MIYEKITDFVPEGPKNNDFIKKRNDFSPEAPKAMIHKKNITDFVQEGPKTMKCRILFDICGNCTL